MEPEQVTATPQAVPPQYSMFTIQLIKALEAGRPGDLKTYAELTDACGRDVNIPAGQGNLQSARRHCLRHHGVVWVPVYGKRQLRCLNDSEKLILLGANARRQYRASGRNITLSAVIDPTELSRDEQQRHHVLTAGNATIRLMMGTKGLRELEQSARVAVPKLADLVTVMREN